MSEFLEKAKKTREYLDYLVEHYTNVQNVFVIAKTKWIGEIDVDFNLLKHLVTMHDLDKFDKEEFVQYRVNFSPTEKEEIEIDDREDIADEAFEHHISANTHHYQNLDESSEFYNIHLTHMLIDWIAMGIKFKNTAIEYYKKDSHKMNFSKETHQEVMKLLELYYN